MDTTTGSGDPFVLQIATGLLDIVLAGTTAALDFAFQLLGLIIQLVLINNGLNTNTLLGS